MIEWNCNTSKVHGNSTTEKRDAVEVILAFSAPSPQKTTSVPSRRDHARALGVLPSTLDRVDAHLIKKRRQLTTSKRGVHGALFKHKKGFSKVDEAHRLLLVSTMTMTAMKARKRAKRRARRRARRRASLVMVRSSRGSTARGTRRMMLLTWRNRRLPSPPQINL